MNSSTMRGGVATLALLFAAACVPKPPGELVSARQAYEHARTSIAASLAPAELHVAAEALADAEAAFDKDPKDYTTIDLAYVAHRTAQMAEAHAAVNRAQNVSAAASEALSTERGEMLVASKNELAASNSQLAASQGQLSASEGQRAATEGELALSREQLATSEQGRLSAIAALAALAAVQEERGTVITLSGSVLFTSGESTLLPSAQTKLDQVAAALVAVKERPLVVEGHTDSQGTDSDNLALSQRRADAVRTYLVSRGCTAELATARGIGESRPIADNETAEGRANNRRVEIVIQGN